jgi:branched-chain amino acid transport system permease protein
MTDTWRKNSFLIFLLFLAILVTLVKNAFVLHVLIMIFATAALSLAWNIAGGYAGQFSIGHAAYYGIGAYTSTLLYSHFGISPWIGMVAGGVLAVIASLVVGIPCLRLRGTFFILSTLAYTEVLRILATHFKGLTRGSLGVTLEFKPSFFNMMFSGKEPYAYIALSLMALVYYFSVWMEKSRLGYYFVAVKENEDGAMALGINTYLMKLLAFTISAFFTAIVGSFFAQYIMFIEPESEFSPLLSISFTLPAMIGGIGSTIGPVIGAFMITPFQELPRFLIGGQYQGLQNVVFGTILIVVVICIPQGVLKWSKERIWHKGVKL